MSKLSTFKSLSLAVGALCLTSLAGIQDSVAADAQMQAANLLQHNSTWSAGTDGFQQSSSGKIYTSQEQAQRILQPVIDVAVSDAGSGHFMTYEPVNPQLQAVQILSRNLNCSPTAC